MSYSELNKKELVAKCEELEGLLVDSEERVAILVAEKEASKKTIVKAATEPSRTVARVNALSAKKRADREKLNKKK